MRPLADDAEISDGQALHQAATDAIAQLPGFDKLVHDQLDALFPLTTRGGISSGDPGETSDRAAYYAWVLRVFATGLGRRTTLGAMLFDERVVPFLIASELGDTPAGRELRQRVLWRYVTEFAAPAQDRFAEKAREQPFTKSVYLREAKQGSDWSEVARER